MLDGNVVVATPNGAFSGQMNIPFFELSSNSWKAGFPASMSDRRWFAVACIGTDLYLAGGYRQNLTNKVDRTILRYNAVAASAGAAWSYPTAQMTQARYEAAAVAVGNEIFVVGGKDETQSFRSVEAFNTATSSWRSPPAMFRPRAEHRAVLLNGQLYVIGGKLGTGAATATPVVERYTP
jgi:N-acetylneuraminic acid mutarotase